MNKLLNKLAELEDREKIIINKKMKIKNNGAKNHLSKVEYELDYKYYICDFCGEEIKIAKNKDESLGGIAYFPKSLTKRNDIKLALHNTCLKGAIAEFEGMLKNNGEE